MLALGLAFVCASWYAPLMAQRRHHYEQAFELYLRTFRIPYVAVDEARKALLPENSVFRVRRDEPPGAPGSRESSLKSFDFVIYGEPSAGLVGHDRQGSNLLVEVKGRRIGRRPRGGPSPVKSAISREGPENRGAARTGRLDSWVTLEDVRSLQTWQELFGPEFKAAFVFIYWCDEQPPDGLFQEIFDHRGRWYAIRSVTVDDYAKAMRTRSTRWGTVHVAPGTFERISQPLTAGPREPRTVPDGLPTLESLPDFGPRLPTLGMA